MTFIISEMAISDSAYLFGSVKMKCFSLKNITLQVASFYFRWLSLDYKYFVAAISNLSLANA